MSFRCIVCEESPDDGTTTSTVQQKGSQSFIDASTKRGDGKSVLFKLAKLPLKLHEKCRKSYPHKKSIAAFLKKNKIEWQSNATSLRSNVSTFSFKTHCFICGKHAPPDYKKKEMEKPTQYRNLVFLVLDKTQKVDKNVLRLARERNDDYGRAIIERSAAVHDLRAADAQYHFLCMKNLNRLRRKGNPPTGGRPKDVVDDAMQSIFEYLENSSEGSQFTIEELMNEIDPKCTRSHLLKLSKTASLRNAVVLAKKKGDINKWRKKSIAIADCLLTTVRPNSYVSPLQVDVAEFLYRKYGSRRLLDVISSFGNLAREIYTYILFRGSANR
ncbi:hypothetical protein JTB14_004950 [Gonioctena quinquepunctata]|nr:hypothetical protein JTB14_004950 [Gonioctena quinquepunctata]